MPLICNGNTSLSFESVIVVVPGVSTEYFHFCFGTPVSGVAKIISGVTGDDIGSISV